jgi:cysteine desulfurase/selenocysteine lyase
MFNPYIKDFPVLKQTVNGKRLVYLDNAATTQKPQTVIDALTTYYSRNNANPHRGAYALSVRTTELYEAARETVREFIGAGSTREIVFTKGATESLNLLAYSYGMNTVQEGDEIVVSIAEHHSNLVPWQQVAAAKKAKLVYLYLDENGMIPEQEIETKISQKTKIVSVTHASNVLGVMSPMESIVKKAHEVGAIVIADLTQSIAHRKLDIAKLGLDFAVFSGHKMYAPMGIGVLYGKEKYLEQMPPFLYGGDMIEAVAEQSATFAPLPQKFEAGTQNVEAVVGLSAAIQYIQTIGFGEIQRIEKPLIQYALQRLSENPYLTLVGNSDPEERTGVISFNVEEVHPHDVASILDADGICVRSGHHCAHPLMNYLGLTATARISLCFYNTDEDIDRLAESLKHVRRWLGLGSE